MAPEQAEGARVTPACDVYSLALTLFETWTGQNPVRAAGPAATARRLGRPLPSLSRVRRDLPLELCDAIDDALEVDPAQRPTPAELRAELQAAQSELTDEGGLVEPETLRRVGLPSTGSRRGLFRRGARAGAPAGPLPAVGGPEDPRPATQRTGLLGRAVAAQPPSKTVRLAQRAGAGLLAGALVFAVLSSLGPEPAFSKLTAAAVAAGATALLPRIGWMLSVLGLCVWLVAPETDRQGTAVVLAAAALPVPFLLPRAGLLWSLPILCPLLGTIALAPAFVGIAALAPTPWRRAGLAAAGLWWLVLGEALTGNALLFGSPDGTTPLADWEGSISAAVSDVLVPLAGSPVLAPALVWAAFAVALPFVVRGRWLAVDLAGAGVWALGLIAAQVALGDALAAEVALDQARGAVAGSIAAALVALSVSQIVAPAEGWRAPRTSDHDGLGEGYPPGTAMSMLRNLEAKLGGLVEGAFGRAFKTSVQPVELAHKLAKEMEENQMVSVSRVYVPNHYRVFLSPQDREQFTSYEPALRKELSDYLLEHARQESMALTSRPQIEFHTDDRLELGEFGIQAQLLAPPEEEQLEEAAAEPAPSAGDFGHTMVYSPDRAARKLEMPVERRQALLVSEGRRNVLSGDRVVIGRSRECDVVVSDPNVSRRHAELRRDENGWHAVDLGSTNGVKVNGRRVDQVVLRDGDRITVGVSDLTFELEVLPASLTVALGRPGSRLTTRAMLVDASASTALARSSRTILTRPTIDGALGGKPGDTGGRAARRRAQVRLPSRSLPVPAVGGAQRHARPLAL